MADSPTTPGSLFAAARAFVGPAVLVFASLAAVSVVARAQVVLTLPNSAQTSNYDAATGFFAQQFAVGANGVAGVRYGFDSLTYTQETVEGTSNMTFYLDISPGLSGGTIAAGTTIPVTFSFNLGASALTITSWSLG